MQFVGQEERRASDTVFFTSDNNDNRMTNQLANTKHQKPGFNLKAAAKSITPFLNEIEKPNVTFGIPV